MRALCLAITYLVASYAYAYERFISPNGGFEAYTTRNADDGTGMKLFLHRAKSHDAGILVFENMRWLDAKWSPDSRFLAVVDHNDGHIADVYVFGVRAADAAQPQITLYYHTPDLSTYDVQWEVLGWRLSERSIILRKQVRDTNGQKPTYHKTIIAQIGDAPLPLANES